MRKKVGLTALFAGIIIALSVLVYYLSLPAVTIHSVGFWFYIIFVTLLAAIVFSFAAYDSLEGKAFIGFLVPSGMLVLLAIFAFASSNLFHAANAQSIANVKISELSFEEAFPDLANRENLTTLALVDLDTAKMLGDKKEASLPNAPWYDVDDEYNLVRYLDGYYRLSGIDYGGLFKFSKARDNGLPAYVLVDCLLDNGKVTQEATLVTLDQPMQYSSGAYWDKDLKRHLRGQYPSDILGSSFLEIDESGVLYWITSVEKPTAFLFGDMKAVSFILTNAATGKSQKYKPEELPTWIDHAYSLSYLMEIAEWHYCFGEGFWNSIFGKTGVWNTAYSYRDSSSKKSDSEVGKFANFYGYSSFVDRNGDVLFYTGLTPANGAESNVAWLVANPRTGEMVQYNVQGAEESSAQDAVEQLVQAQKYEATFPIPCNISGHPTYAMCLKGKSGLTAGYALCNIENFSIATQADTLDKAIDQYISMLDSDVVVTDDGQLEEITGKITWMSSAIIDGNTYYYYEIKGRSEIYRSSIKINELQVCFAVGDSIKIKVRLDESHEIAEIEPVT